MQFCNTISVTNLNNLKQFIMAKSNEARIELLEYKLKQEKKRVRQLENIVEKMGEYLADQIQQIVDKINTPDEELVAEEAAKVGFAQAYEINAEDEEMEDEE